MGTAAGSVWALIAAALILVAGSWLDLLWELSPQGRIVALATTVAAGGLLLVVSVWRTSLAGRDALLAGRLDHAAGLGGDILTGLELERSTGDSDAHLTAGLARIAADRAAALAAEVPLQKAVPARPLARSVGWLAILAMAVGLLAVLLPELAETEWNRFLHPYSDVPPFSRTKFTVEPGDVEVLYGSELSIVAIAEGAPVDRVDLVVEGSQQEPPLAMFPEADGRWRAVLAKVTEPAVYHVRAYRARSAKHQIRVLTVPQIESVRVEITPPSYTGQTTYQGPVPQDGLAGLPGTTVRLHVHSNRPLAGGRLTLTGQGDPPDRAMNPAATGSREAVGEFAIRGDGKFEVHVTDVDGQSSQQSLAGKITLLADQRPFIRLLQPRATSLATPTTNLPVSLAAEDDYGISRVQLFRSLNDSPPLPMDVPLGRRLLRRANETLYLPFASFGLEPGDVIKLFGRVEDNDPAGAKGAESSVATVRIISQEEFERLLRARQGLEVLLSKYRQGERRLEELAKELEELRKKAAASTDKPASQELQKEIKRVLQRLVRETAELRKAAELKLPYDVDQNLSPQLHRLAAEFDDLVGELERLSSGSGDGSKIDAELKKLLKRLADRKKQYQQETMEPLEHLEKIFPLLADQDRFVVLTLRQEELAERMAALRGHDGEDSPALKARMRDLEEEQKEIREALAKLLDDIENHLMQVPDEPEFDTLRESTAAFVEKVRSSTAAEVMAEAESSLAEFAGTKAAEKAKEAAEILRRFVSDCETMGGNAGQCLVFRPSLSQALGNTADQLLAEMGYGNGGSGMGMYGAGGGPLGLYGNLAGIGYDGFGPPMAPGASPGDAPGGLNPDEPTRAGIGSDAATGITEGNIPVGYRRRVGQYFQRISAELEALDR
jgi:hypothetical protein